MLELDLTLPSPEENLALDEALLEWCANCPGSEVLRFWESPVPFVVLGRSNEADTEVDRAACAQLGLPVLRRCSGGGTVVQGPGCLNFALVLDLAARPELATVTRTNRVVLETHRLMLETLLGRAVRVQGVTDLTVGGRKVSGNAQKRGRAHALFHGTFLLHFDLDLMSRVLRAPSRPPQYRARRSHDRFAMNLGIEAAALKGMLRETWKARERFGPLPRACLDTLLRERYRRPEWHERLEAGRRDG